MTEGDAGASTPDEAAVLAANSAFYDAFEARDLDALLGLWEQSDRVVCTHPGWRTLIGYESVAESWRDLLAGPQRLQFILTDLRVEVVGEVAFVTGDENLLEGASGGTVAALNLFVRSDGLWRLVAHHGSSVVGR